MRVLALLLAILCVPSLAQAQESIAGLQEADGQTHVLQGEIMTLWYDSFLLYDGTGQVTVNIAPATTSSLGFQIGDAMKITGTLTAGAFKPLAIMSPAGGTLMFADEATTKAYAPIPAKELAVGNRFTRQYRHFSAAAPEDGKSSE